MFHIPHLISSLVVRSIAEPKFILDSNIARIKDNNQNQNKILMSFLENFINALVQEHDVICINCK
jgi:hypothetical protein